MDDRLPTSRGAIVLCGGASSRMGRDKAWLPFGSHGTMLECAVRILGGVAPEQNIVVVAGRRQQVPPLAGEVTVVHERGEGEGPLAALVEGLARLPAGVDMAFVCGCDAPLLRPALIERLLSLAGTDFEAVVPTDAERLYPLAAVYAIRGLPGLRAATASGERSLHRALRGGHLVVREVGVEDLRAVDPELESLVNCNTPEEYAWALARAGFKS